MFLVVEFSTVFGNQVISLPSVKLILEAVRVQLLTNPGLTLQGLKIHLRLHTYSDINLIDFKDVWKFLLNF